MEEIVSPPLSVEETTVVLMEPGRVTVELDVITVMDTGALELELLALELIVDVISEVETLVVGGT